MEPSSRWKCLPPLSLRHSFFFYVGFMPVLLILIAWADSAKWHTNWYHRLDRGGSVCFIVSNCKFQFERITRNPGFVPPRPPKATPFYGGVHRFGALRRDKDGGPMPIFPPLKWKDREAADRAPGYHVDAYHVPLWFLLLCYLPVWFGGSYLDLRRKRRRLLSELPQVET